MKKNSLLLVASVVCLALAAGCAGKPKHQTRKKIQSLSDRELIAQNPALHSRIVAEEKSSVFGRYQPIDQQKFEALNEQDRAVVGEITGAHGPERTPAGGPEVIRLRIARPGRPTSRAASSSSTAPTPASTSSGPTASTSWPGITSRAIRAQEARSLSASSAATFWSWKVIESRCLHQTHQSA